MQAELSDGPDDLPEESGKEQEIKRANIEFQKIGKSITYQKNRLKSARRAKHQINAANKIARGTKGDLEIDIPDLDPLPESVLNSVNTARYKNRHTNQVQKPRKATCPESVVRSDGTEVLQYSNRNKNLLKVDEKVQNFKFDILFKGSTAKYRKLKASESLKAKLIQ